MNSESYKNWAIPAVLGALTAGYALTSGYAYYSTTNKETQDIKKNPIKGNMVDASTEVTPSIIMSPRSIIADLDQTDGPVISRKSSNESITTLRENTSTSYENASTSPINIYQLIDAQLNTYVTDSTDSTDITDSTDKKGKGGWWY